MILTEIWQYVSQIKMYIFAIIISLFEMYIKERSEVYLNVIAWGYALYLMHTTKRLERKIKKSQAILHQHTHTHAHTCILYIIYYIL